MARRLGVSRQDVVDAAVRVVDDHGLDALTVAAVAGQVGCRPPSVYHHVDGLDGLVRAVALVATHDLRRVFEGVVEGGGGVPALLEAALSYASESGGRFDAVLRPVPKGLDEELSVARREVLGPVRDAIAAEGVDEAAVEEWLVVATASVRGLVAVERAQEPGDAAARTAARTALVGAIAAAADGSGVLTASRA